MISDAVECHCNVLLKRGNNFMEFTTTFRFRLFINEIVTVELSSYHFIVVVIIIIIIMVNIIIIMVNIIIITIITMMMMIIIIFNIFIIIIFTLFKPSSRRH